MPAVQAAREAAFRMSCGNNMKQFGLGVHNFNDTQDALPPAFTAMTRMSFFPLLYPYMEQQNLYNLLTEGDAGTTKRDGVDRVFNSTWWDALTEDERVSLSSVDFMKCPTRRTGPVYSSKSVTGNSRGPLGDYAAIVTVRHEGVTTASHRQWWQRLGQAAADSHCGPFRQGLATFNTSDSDWLVSWKSRDGMSRWADGTSNMLIVAERHVPFIRLTQCANHAGAGNVARYQKDCSFLAAQGAELYFGFLTSPKKDENNYNGKELPRSINWGSGPTNKGGKDGTTDVNALFGYALGSYHPGGLNILLGDGSVRFIGNTTNTTLLVYLSIIDDGEAVSLP